MYKDTRQLRIEDYVFPYGDLDPKNDWIKLAALVLWETAWEQYAAQFVNNGAPAHPCRMALGALLIQRRLKCSDEWLVKYIGENPYMQFFRLDFELYNASEDFWKAIYRYHDRYGRWPEHVLADKIY